MTSTLLSNELTLRRQNVVTGFYTNISPRRVSRPYNITPTKDKLPSISDREDKLAAPHKHGNKPPLILRNYYGEADLDNWSIQALENLNPIAEAPRDVFLFNAETEEFKDYYQGARFSYDPYTQKYGHHWMMITQDAEKDIGEMPDELVLEYLQVSADLYYRNTLDSNIKQISFFKNVGENAGASQLHPHSQVLAEDVVSPFVEIQMGNASRFYSEYGFEIFDAILERELAFEKRILYQNSDFLVFCPYAPMASYEIQIMPLSQDCYCCESFHSFSHFEEMYLGDTQRSCLVNLALALKNAVSMLQNTIGNLSYNVLLRSCPVNGFGEHNHWRWHFSIIPRFGKYAGYEIATYNSAIITTPEASAEEIKLKNR